MLVPKVTSPLRQVWFLTRSLPNSDSFGLRHALLSIEGRVFAQAQRYLCARLLDQFVAFGA
jgi:hypothetical protein